MKDILIIGGGLAGLISGIQFARRGIPCTVVEKKNYPMHRVCGEYISNEVVPFLKSIDAFPTEIDISSIHEFQLSAVNGKSSLLNLEMGGFGISRYAFDYFLFNKALSLGVKFKLQTEVIDIKFLNEKFIVKTTDQELQADVVVGGFGKRSKADLALNRSFIQKRSPYVGVKYHVKTDFPADRIALHNFEGGYCGASCVEDGIVNICYLSHRDVLKQHKSISEMEQQVLFKNPLLKELFQNSHFLFEKPETINEISFATKEPVHEHVLMAGDAAGMITPLCGNGMAMAIRSAKVLSEMIIKFCTTPGYSRQQLEHDYAKAWNELFRQHLWEGRQVQKLFGNAFTSSLAINLMIYSKPLARQIVKRTHGDYF